MTTATKERPILFSAPMVRAILDGRKSQTRRVVKNPFPVMRIAWGGTAAVWCAIDGRPYPEHGIRKAPYLPGDRLWVRETWRELGSGQRADQKIPKIKVPVLYAADEPLEGPWRSPIHMPRWASRILLEVTEVRVQRVQDISEEDAIAEGVEFGCYFAGKCRTCARGAFMDLWNSINGKTHPWLSNPWVWAITFRKLEPSDD